MTAMTPSADRQRAKLPIVFVTGLSGAGKSTALHALEDIGYEVVDNFPLSLLTPLIDGTGPGRTPALALGIDIRTRGFTAEAFAERLTALRQRHDIATTLLYLDCDTDILHQRFTETRRRHPLAQNGPVADGIREEKQSLSELQARADHCWDTSELTIAQLADMIAKTFALNSENRLTLSMLSFAFRHGLPREADLVMDVRWLRNPHYDPQLRPLTGKVAAVADYVAADPLCEPFLSRFVDLLLLLLPQYQNEGKSYLTIAVGCTGGQHRSVFVVEEVARRLAAAGWHSNRRHRELGP